MSILQYIFFSLSFLVFPWFSQLADSLTWKKTNCKITNQKFLTSWLMFIYGGFTNTLSFWSQHENQTHGLKGTFSEAWILSWTVWLLHSQSDSGKSLLLVLILTEHTDNCFHTDGSSGENGFCFYGLFHDFCWMIISW